MILVDTSVWIDHLNKTDPVFTLLLEAERVLLHPFVVGEIALGTVRHRVRLFQTLNEFPRAEVATDDEVLRLIERHSLFGKGIGYVDAHLLAACAIVAGTSLLTRDRRLFDIAAELGFAATP